MHNILILAQPKSGTTILFQILKESLPGETVGIFEPATCRPDEPGQLAGKNVVAKVLFQPIRGYDHYSPEACAFFDKRVFIHRDPRDMLLSYLLYVSYNLPTTSDFLACAQFASTLRAKEQTPQRISILELFRLQQRLAGMRLSALRMVETYLQALRFAVNVSRRHAAGVFRIRYEDIVDRKFDALEQYLGFPLATVSDVAPQYARVARSKGYGEWRNWFLPEDVNYFRPRFAEFMAEFGYADDWHLADEPRVLAKNASGYLLRLADERGHFRALDYRAESFPAELSPAVDPAVEQRDYLIPHLACRVVEHYPTHGAQIVDPHVETPEGQRVNVLTYGRRYVYRYAVQCDAALADVSFWCLFRNRAGDEVESAGSEYQGQRFPAIAAGARLGVEYHFVCTLKPDVYFLNAGVTTAQDGVPVHTVHRIVNAWTIVVRPSPLPADTRPPHFAVSDAAG
jgi:hypothetical protein